jgi:GH35 family endo-1,4-beta-xylanase
MNRKSNDVYNLVRDLKQRGLVDPLLLDEQYRARPAFFGVEDALLGR